MLIVNYEHKIKNPQEISSLIGNMPREKKVIMLHGTWDLVHVGHIRHMIYSKSKADILIASLTCDAHITKGNVRPYVPQDLRAMNLAVLGMVDYVVVDNNPVPLENISIIKPDFFSKGFEYSSAHSTKTQEETELVESYGGQMIFTPGDVVYSSTQLINVAPPKLGIEKLITLMQAEGIDFNDLRRLVFGMKGLKVHVVGDTIVDSYIYTNMIGGMAKTPTISVKLDHMEDFIGGAAVVAKHLQAAGAEVEFSTVLGNDNLAALVEADVVRSGVKIKSFQDGRVTTNKAVIISNEYRLLKVDKVDNRTINDDTLIKLQLRIANVPSDVIIFSDFRHGIFNGSTIPALTDAIPDDTFCAADSQVASRWGNILDFQGFDLITPNEKEARFALGDQDSVIRPLAAKLYQEADCETLILKCGESGTLTMKSDDETDFRSSFALDSFCYRAIDPVGAGDALLAYSTLALKRNAGPVAASILGGIAAGIECGYSGNIPVTSEKVLEQINLLEKTANYESR